MLLHHHTRIPTVGTLCILRLGDSRKCFHGFCRYPSWLQFWIILNVSIRDCFLSDESLYQTCADGRDVHYLVFSFPFFLWFSSFSNTRLDVTVFISCLEATRVFRPTEFDWKTVYMTVSRLCESEYAPRQARAFVVCLLRVLTTLWFPLRFSKSNRRPDGATNWFGVLIYDHRIYIKSFFLYVSFFKNMICMFCPFFCMYLILRFSCLSLKLHQICKKRNINIW